MQSLPEYFIKESIVSEEEMNDIILEVVLNKPNVAEIIFENKFLSLEQQLDVFSYINEKQVCYKEALIQCNLYSDSLIDNIKSIESRYAGEIYRQLENNKILTFPEITSHLDSYISTIEQSDSGNEENFDSTSEIAKIDSTINLNNSVLDDLSLKELPFTPVFSEAESVIIGEFATMMNDSKKNRVYSFVEKLSDKLSEEELVETCNSVVEEFEEIYGGARFIGANLIENLSSISLTKIEGYIENIQSKKNSVDSYKKEFFQNIDIIWTISESIKKDKSENNYWNINRNTYVARYLDTEKLS